MSLFDHRQVEPSLIMIQQPIFTLKRWQWWVLVAVNVNLLLIGQSGAVLLGKIYFDQGGRSTWMGALVQTAAFPVLYLPFFFFPSRTDPPNATINTPRQPSATIITLLYVFIGILLAVDNMLYSVGLLCLPISTYSLLCASQLAFNALFSFFINREKLTGLILNSVVLLTLSASIVAVHGDHPVGKNNKKPDKGKYTIGFLFTICASAAYALLLSLMQLSFEKVLKKETFAVVLHMQIYTSLVATCICIVGLFASGEGINLKDDMDGFKGGKALYVLTLLGTALAWQVCSVGMVGLIFLVSSLFSNFISMLTLPFVPIFAVLFYDEKMDMIKVVAMLLGILGFASYLYQNYLDDKESKKTENV